jgi:folylpolyglutamate synthase/dihydropteroate synthase
VREVCREQDARLVELPPTDSAKWTAYFAAAGSGLPPDSAELLIAALDELAAVSQGHLALTAAQRESGLSHINYRARMERGILKGAPVLLDAAHNIDSLRWLARMLQALAAPSARDAGYPVVFGCQATREPAELLASLKPQIEVLVPIEIPLLRPCPVKRIIGVAQSLDIPVSLPAAFSVNDIPAEYQIGNITELDPPDNRTGWIECVEHGLSLASTGRPTVICGSIYYLGEILRIFED